jgi:hypothetical protein
MLSEPSYLINGKEGALTYRRRLRGGLRLIAIYVIKIVLQA